MPICPNCKKPTEAGMEFCQNCGHPLPSTGATAKRQGGMVECSKCHTLVAPGNAFCTNCRNPLPITVPTSYSDSSVRRATISVATILVMLGAGYAGYRHFFATKRVLVLDASFTPQLDPQATTTTTVVSDQATALSLGDGAGVTIPSGAFDAGTAVKLARAINTPASLGTSEALSPVYHVTAGPKDQSQPQEPVSLELPISQEMLHKAGAISPDEITISRWNGTDWIPIGSTVDLQQGKVSAPVSHFSDYGVRKSTRYETGPADIVLNPILHHDRRAGMVIPRGATVNGIVYSEGLRYMTVKSDGMEFGDGKGGFRKGEGAVNAKAVRRYLPDRRTDVELTENSFIVRVPVDTNLGEVRVTLSATDGRSEVASFTVVNPLVVIVDIDGFRQDLFHLLLESQPVHTNPDFGKFRGENIKKLVGNLTREINAGSLRVKQYARGRSLLETATIFPTVTAVGHAAIFTGTDPKFFGVAGNNWFDRTEGNPYGYMGYDTVDQLMITFLEAANNRIRSRPWNAHTVYEDANEQAGGVQSVVFENFYFGDKSKAAARWVSKSLVGGALYLPCKTTHISDLWMSQAASSWMHIRDFGAPTNEQAATIFAYRQSGMNPGIPWQELHKLGILTLYFAGLDHTGHEGTPSGLRHGGRSFLLKERQIDYMLQYVDPFLGDFLGMMSDVEYKNTTFVFIADHGQVDMIRPTGGSQEVHCFLSRQLVDQITCRGKLEELMYAFGYLPPSELQVFGSGLIPGAHTGVRRITHREATAEVGLNGGIAHIYLRRYRENGKIPPVRVTKILDDKLVLGAEIGSFEDWSRYPTWNQVLSVADRFRTWSESGLNAGVMQNVPEPPQYRKSIALILVRNAESGFIGDYQVFLGTNPQTNQYSVMPLKDFLQANSDPYMTHFEWSNPQRDAPFLADRIQRSNSAMSGDIILVPWYPDWYFDAKVLQGNHGGLNRFEFEVPFAAFRSGSGPKDLEHIQQLLTESVNLNGTKDRPAVTDLKKFVVELLKDPVRFEDSRSVETPISFCNTNWEDVDTKSARIRFGPCPAAGQMSGILEGPDYRSVPFAGSFDGAKLSIQPQAGSATEFKVVNSAKMNGTLTLSDSAGNPRTYSGNWSAF
jgi:Type I phosphodiesterase / nucleotide pyrophosphatase/Double zinc ribbon